MSESHKQPMPREEFKNWLQESIRTEESAVRIYYKHIRSIVSRSGLSKEIQEEIKDVVDSLGKDSEKHKTIVEEMLKELNEGENNDR